MAAPSRSFKTVSLFNTIAIVTKLFDRCANNKFSNQYMTPVASSPTQYAVAINRTLAQTFGRRRLTEEVPVQSQLEFVV